MWFRRRSDQHAAPTQELMESFAGEAIDVLAAAGVLVDDFDRVVRASEGAVRMSLVAGKRLVHAPLVELVRRARQADQVLEAEAELASQPGVDTKYVAARAAKFGERFVILLVDDRTETRRLESIRRDFVANVSHELKTPIGAISLLAEAIQNATEEPDTVAKFADSLQRESHRLGNLVQEIIELSRVQGGIVPEARTQLDMRTVVVDAIDRNQLLAEQRGIRLVANAPAGIKLMGDQEMLTVAVRNLVENAIVYSESGTQVGVGLREADGTVEVSVTDSGIGIPEPEQERIFERFYRIDPSRSRETGGTGLGLSIVKHAVANHGGEVKLFSRNGVGSTFTIRIPKSGETE